MLTAFATISFAAPVSGPPGKTTQLTLISGIRKTLGVAVSTFLAND